ncbi:MAG: flagellar hook-length control protein FliK [Clostridium sp.]
MNTKGITIQSNEACINIDAKNSLTKNSGKESDFLELLTKLLNLGSEGKDALISLLKSNEVNTGDVKNPQDIGTLINGLNLRLNTDEGLGKKDNFILGEEDIEKLLSNLKESSQDMTNENISKYFNGVNLENGFLKIRALENLNFQAQNSNISSTISGIINNLPESSLENKEILNALKFLQQFTKSDGSLDTSKLIKNLESNSRADGAALMNQINIPQANNSSDTTSEVNVFKYSDITDAIVENFKNLRLPGRCEMRIKLNPRELGEITIKLVLEKGQVSAVISSDKKETVTLLQSNMQNLLDQLKDSGTDLHHLAVNLSHEENSEEARRGYKQEKEESEENDFEGIFDDLFNEDSNDEFNQVI